MPGERLSRRNCSGLKLRDRDAIVTREDLIFRVYGYFHPPTGYVCDVEYASSEIFKSADPRALRQRGSTVFYKFYADEGLRFVVENYPQYTVFYEPLQRKLVGVENKQIRETRKPERKLQELLRKPPEDELLTALHRLVDMVTQRSELKSGDLGVFGSLLHGFYHPKFSDLDLTVYGKKELTKLCEALQEVYRENGSPLRNEFESEKAIEGKSWRFLNYSPREFLTHQRRKMIYAVFHDEKSGRNVKVEFEPVKRWNEIFNEYDSRVRITHKSWIKAVARVTDDSEASFMPSIYKVEVLEILDGPKVDEIQRVISYVEEFRMQAKRDELVLVEGNLEQVTTPTGSFHQITLTYGPRYYEQVLKLLQR